MKYPQLVHITRDVEDWLEEQLEARGINGAVYSRYILNLLSQDSFDESDVSLPVLTSKGNGHWKEPKKEHHDMHDWRAWDRESLKRLAVVQCLMSASNERYDIEKLVDELCAKLKKINDEGGKSRFEVMSSQCVAEPITDPTLEYYAAFQAFKDYGNSKHQMQPSLSKRANWTRGLLHDSMSAHYQNKMEDCFSALFYENATDDFGFGFTRNKSNERQDGNRNDRINYFNKQNLLADDASERLYERNTDIDRLIAKFDTNIEEIWKPTNESNEFYNLKCQSLFSQNILSSSYIQYGSNLIWAFKQNDENVNIKNLVAPATDPPDYNYKNIPNWNKLSPLPDYGVDELLNGVNLTLSNITKWSSLDGKDNGCNHLLNHNKNDSGFTELVNKVTTDVENTSHTTFVADTENLQEEEEEDLLTSAKTHFRPIRVEEVQTNQTAVYADGTTFAISNELEKVTFKRSESGTLYLDADAEQEAPRKYMEYKEKETNHKLGSESDLSSMEEFVPKFRVRQSNEKCCQTEEIDDDQMVPLFNETDCDSDSSESEINEFFFPGDDELAQNIINSLDEETQVESKKIKADCNYNSIHVNDNEGMEILELGLLKLPNPLMCDCIHGKEWGKNWNKKPVGKQEWNEIWSPQNPCDICKSNSDKISSKDKYCRFREELTQDGEQLLSDLSCLQQLYSNSDWCDDDSTTASDFNDDETLNNQPEYFLPKDILFSTEVLDNYNNIQRDPSLRNLWKVDSPKHILDLKNLWSNEYHPDGLTEIGEGQNEITERPVITDAAQKERKRRNSSSQRACNLYMEGQCRRPHCRFAHCDSAVPCPFFADASCLKGDSCPLSHGLRRPLSL